MIEAKKFSGRFEKFFVKKENRHKATRRELETRHKLQPCRRNAFIRREAGDCARAVSVCRAPRYSERPSNGIGVSAAMSTSSRQRTLTAIMSLPFGLMPRENAPTPHCGQNR